MIKLSAKIDLKIKCFDSWPTDNERWIFESIMFDIYSRASLYLLITVVVLLKAKLSFFSISLFKLSKSLMASSNILIV